MSETRKKVNGAEYQLKEMCKHATAPNEFKYSYDALLDAFDSALEFMSHEFSGKCKTRRDNMWDKCGNVQLLKILRNATHHIYNPKLRQNITIYAPVAEARAEGVPATVHIDDGHNIVVLTPDQNESIQYEPPKQKQQVQQKQASDIEIRWFIDKKGFNEKDNQQINKIPRIGKILKTDVITICEEAINELNDTVTECEKE